MLPRRAGYTGVMTTLRWVLGSWWLLTLPAMAAPGEPLAAAQARVAREPGAHATFWLQGSRVFAEKWTFGKGTSLARADRLRLQLCGGKKPRQVFPFGHGQAGGVTYTYANGLVITVEARLDKLSGRYDHVTSLFVAPDGTDELALGERKDLRRVR